MLVDKIPADPARYTRQQVFTRNARSGLLHLLRSPAVAPAGRILLPDYIGYSPNEGSGVMDPIQEAGLGYEFYRIDGRLQVDLQDFERKLRQEKFTAALVIHYFGFAEPGIRELAALCRSQGVVLIEDCCHSLSSQYQQQQLGSFGDYTIFSIHKYLPAASGGLLQFNRPDGVLPPLPAESCISRQALEVYCNADLQEIARRRCENYRQLVELLEGVPGIALLRPELPEGTIPMNLPLLIQSADRYQVYLQLIEEEIRPVALYYQLIPEIELAEHVAAAGVSAQILNLPIHQEVTPEQLEILATRFRRVMESFTEQGTASPFSQES